MKTYGKINIRKSGIKRNVSVEGERLETKIERIVTNKEPIKDGAPIIYTEREEGVISAYNIKTDRWEIAAEAMDTVSKSETAKRMQRIEERKKPLEPIGGAEPTGGTNEQA